MIKSLVGVFMVAALLGCTSAYQKTIAGNTAHNAHASTIGAQEGILCHASTPNCLEAFDEPGRLCYATEDCSQDGFLLKTPN